MGKGDPIKIREIKAMPIMEFWAFYDNTMKQIKNETELHKAKKKR